MAVSGVGPELTVTSSIFQSEDSHTSRTVNVAHWVSVTGCGFLAPYTAPAHTVTVAVFSSTEPAVTDSGVSCWPSPGSAARDGPGIARAASVAVVASDVAVIVAGSSPPTDAV